MKSSLSDAGKKLTRFLVRHRFGVLLVCVVAYFLFWPKPVPHVSVENEKPIVVPQGQNKTPSVVQPEQSTSNSVAKTAASVPLYDPATADADANWSLPAELKSEEVQSFARQVDNLLKDWKEMKRLEKLQSSLIYIHTRDTVKDALWPGINGNGFKDQKLPLDWYELVKEHYSMMGNVAAVQDAMLNTFAKDVIGARLESIQVRVLGGKVLTGDVLCLRAVRGFTDQHLASLTSVVPQLINVAKRLNVEFPAVLSSEMERLASLCPEDFKFVPPEE